MWWLVLKVLMFLAIGVASLVFRWRNRSVDGASDVAQKGESVE
jgi:dolichyl-phosphate-mannose--protein O-mannosyl transferase